MTDYSKAFNTIDYEILITKLHKAGFSKNARHLLCSYLSNRKQYLQMDCETSKQLTVTNGVPQGSILGPVLFNIYVHDLNKNTTSACSQYADDTNIYDSFKPNDIKQRIQLVNQDLEIVEKWSKSNNLIFNASKTKTILFGTRQMLRVKTLLILTLPNSCQWNEISSKERPATRYLALHSLRIFHGRHPTSVWLPPTHHFVRSPRLRGSPCTKAICRVTDTQSLVIYCLPRHSSIPPTPDSEDNNRLC